MLVGLPQQSLPTAEMFILVCVLIQPVHWECAERNAIANMITNGESKITKLVCVMSNGSVGSPCGACREYLMQLDKDSACIEILVNVETEKTVKLSELLPDWWGSDRFI